MIWFFQSFDADPFFTLQQVDDCDPKEVEDELVSDDTEDVPDHELDPEKYSESESETE